MNLKETYLNAMEAYKQSVENWNILIEKNVNLPDCAWDKLLTEMEEAKKTADKAWTEYMNKEILA